MGSAQLKKFEPTGLLEPGGGGLRACACTVWAWHGRGGHILEVLLALAEDTHYDIGIDLFQAVPRQITLICNPTLLSALAVLPVSGLRRAGIGCGSC